ncbi:MAG: hypothetical protein Q9159_004446 [Coniocarpon cinnabarinum]
MTAPTAFSQYPSNAPAHGQPAHLLPATLTPLVTSWLAEDTPSLDYGGFVVGSGAATAKLLGKSQGVVAGIPFFNEVFKQLDCTVEWHVREGQEIKAVTECATVSGEIRKILLGERVALNCLARCSGIATKTASMVRLVREAGYKGVLAGTRKTTPGFRLVEKYGILVGGADGHRYDLSSMVMLKDNHIWSCADTSRLQNGASRGSDVTSQAITNAVRTAKSAAGFSLKVEVECQSFEEAKTAIVAGADVVMLDNFEPADMRRTAKRLKEETKGPGGGGFLIEVSGGLTEENVREFVCDELDVISTSSIHQGVKHVDFSLKVVRQ